MSVVLVVEPETAQGNLLKKMQKRLGATVVVVKSTADAIDAIGHAMPDVILLSALLSPRDEDRLISHLRSLEGASHLQTLTIPQLRHEKAGADGGRKKGFSFRKKRDAAEPSGCDPAVFAEEIASQLARAADLRSRPPSAAHSILINDPAGASEPRVSESVFTESVFSQPVFSEPTPPEVFVPDPIDTVDEAPITFEALARFEEEPVAEAPAPAFVAAPEPVATSADPAITFEELIRFEEQPAAADPWLSVATPIAEPSLESLISLEPIAREPVIEPVFEPTIETVEDEPVEVPKLSVFDAPVRKAPAKIDDELDRLARELGFSLDAGIVDMQNEESAERMAAEVALVHAETEAKLAAELERVRAEAEEHRLTEMARLQANADAQREAAIADARAAAEEETRRALATEVARVRSEAERYGRGSRQ